MIVPVFNGEKFLDRCLDALRGNDYGNFEVVVVDDRSTDRSPLIAREKADRLLEMERNSGPGAARNFAAEKVDGDLLLFVDADVVVRSDTLAQIAQVFQKQEKVAALFGSYDSEPEERNFLSQYRNLLHHYVHQNSNPEASTFWAGLGAMRRDIFLEMGGFDCEKFPVPSIEDIELGARLRNAGHRILLVKEIQVKHLKYWNAVSVLRTDIFCRAYPWSKLILTSQGLINDLNLKTNDRLSAGFSGLAIMLLPFLIFWPALIVLCGLFLGVVAFLNRDLLRFFYQTKGAVFALLAFPWQVLFFLYSGVVFAVCWVMFGLPQMLGIKRKQVSAN